MSSTVYRFAGMTTPPFMGTSGLYPYSESASSPTLHISAPLTSLQVGSRPAPAFYNIIRFTDAQTEFNVASTVQIFDQFPITILNSTGRSTAVGIVPVQWPTIQRYDLS